MLEEVLAARQMTLAVFAKRIGVYRTFVYKLCDGQSPPPSQRIAAWADLLELTPKERRRFMVAAGLGHVPAALRDTVRDALRREARP